MKTSTGVALIRQGLKIQALRTILVDTDIFSRGFEIVAETNDSTSL